MRIENRFQFSVLVFIRFMTSSCGESNVAVEAVELDRSCKQELVINYLKEQIKASAPPSAA